VNPAYRHYWYPVALSSELTDTPRAATVLGERVVIWRCGPDVVAMKDQCVHRGARLSLGRVAGERLLCPYHGWNYDRAGTCTKIPSLPPERPIPEKARVTSYRCREQYGLIFVCLGEPRRPIIDFPEFDDGAARVHFVGPVVFATSAARSFENFMDDTHLSWVHDGRLGQSAEVEPTPPRHIEQLDGEFSYSTDGEVENRLDPSDPKRIKTSARYRIVPPFSLHHAVFMDGACASSKVFFSSPIDDGSCVRFMVVASQIGLDQPAQKQIDYTLATWEEDRPIIETQSPEALPIDLKEEFHLRDPDGPSILYRQLLQALETA
jgi:vanillate O-demethylase monooxygenase subunit